MMNSQFGDKLKEFINEIDREYPIELAYLFGSYAKGTENSQSDIDMASFRNILVHDYIKLDREIVFAVIKNNLDDFRTFARIISGV